MDGDQEMPGAASLIMGRHLLQESSEAKRVVEGAD